MDGTGTFLGAQDAAVVGWDRNTGRLLPVDVAEGQVRGDQAVPVSETEQVELNGGTLAVLDPAKNQVWATHVDLINGIDSLAAVDPSAKPVIKFGAVAVAGSAPHTSSIAVGPDGNGFRRRSTHGPGIRRRAVRIACHRGSFGSLRVDCLVACRV